MKTLERPVLVINKSWMPIRVISVKRAFKLVFAGKASIVLTDQDYSVYDWDKWSKIQVPEEEDGILTVSCKIKIPEVIVLIRFDKIHTKGVRLTKKNLFIRDNYVCQYTGKKVKPNDADIDHVMPKSRGGKSTWDNMVVCSKEVNRKKGNKTPDEAGLSLHKTPSKPTYSRIMIDPKMNMPQSWKKFLIHL